MLKIGIPMIMRRYYDVNYRDYNARDGHFAYNANNKYTDDRYYKANL